MGMGGLQRSGPAAGGQRGLGRAAHLLALAQLLVVLPCVLSARSGRGSKHRVVERSEGVFGTKGVAVMVGRRGYVPPPSSPKKEKEVKKEKEAPAKSKGKPKPEPERRNPLPSVKKSKKDLANEGVVVERKEDGGDWEEKLRNLDTTKPVAPKRTARREQKKLADEAKNWTGDVVMFGDSLTAHLTGEGSKRVGGSLFKPYAEYGQRFTAMKEELGISVHVRAFTGNTIQNLVWRLEHGGEKVGPPPGLVTLLIGTNDLGVNHASPDSIIKGINYVIQQLKSWGPRVRILVIGLFPRTDDLCKAYRVKNRKSSVCPDPTLEVKRSVYYQPIEKINRELEGLALKQHKQVKFISCNANLTRTVFNKLVLKSEMFSLDALHPTGAAGADAVIGCIRPAIADFVGGANRVYLEGVEKERTARKHKAYYDKSSNRGLIDMPDRYERPHHSEEGKGGYKARSSG